MKKKDKVKPWMVTGRFDLKVYLKHEYPFYYNLGLYTWEAIYQYEKDNIK